MSSTRATILIADDDPHVVELLRFFLRPIEADVLTASDGEEALAIAQEKLPHVVLLDVLMPKRSGWEVCQAIKAVQRTSRIRVVLVTGKGDVKDRLTGLQVGADEYLVKPFDRNEVVSRVGRLVEESLGAAAEARVESELHSLLFDPATSLPTVPVVIDRLKEILIEDGELGIIYIDIEQFEAIEAEYGWAYFDELVRKLGEVIREAAGEIFEGAEV
ncbi:MAG TPA: response regulator, partial [Thermoanaerobaculia bacterium]